MRQSGELYEHKLRINPGKITNVFQSTYLDNNQNNTSINYYTNEILNSDSRLDLIYGFTYKLIRF